MKVSAVIFDLDGTVLDNEDVYGAAFRAVLRLLGKKVDDVLLALKCEVSF